jgi:N-formylglutamate deformylase
VRRIATRTADRGTDGGQRGIDCRVGPLFSVTEHDGPLVTTAIHAGHELRPEVAARMVLDDDVRRREEDPFTDLPTAAGGSALVVHRSRFEVDLNRPREGAVYVRPDDAWGLELWREPLTEDQIERSLAEHDEFYAAMADHLDPLAADGPFVVLDLHSYNHRRGGPEAEPAPEIENPEVNVGTGSLDRHRWGGLVERFMAVLATQKVNGHPLDVRENVRFQGGYLSRWVHERYDGTGVALAIELKKVFMDEWTGVPDLDHLGQLTTALSATVPTLIADLR